jgi:hypothetical protein
VVSVRERPLSTARLQEHGSPVAVLLSLIHAARGYAGDAVTLDYIYGLRVPEEASPLGRQKFSGMDLVYAAGLYDYFQLSLAQKLTALPFEMLRAGGRLLVANFHPSLVDIGYMETAMNLVAGAYASLTICFCCNFRDLGPVHPSSGSK